MCTKKRDMSLIKIRADGVGKQHYINLLNEILIVNIYPRFHIQIVFAVNGSGNLISPEHKYALSACKQT